MEKCKNNTRKKEVYLISNKTKFYCKYESNKRYYLIVVDEINNEKIRKRCFNIYGGFISQVEDVYDNNKDILIRYSQNKLLIINNKQVESRVSNIKFNSIDKKDQIDSVNKTKDNALPNTKIGVLDIETFITKDSKSSVFYLSVKDVICDESTFTRQISNTNITIYNDKILKIQMDKYLSIIKQYNVEYKARSNPNIGALDLETFLDLDGYAKVYALGFVINEEQAVTFYLNEHQNSDDLVLECFDLLLTNKYNGYINYVHNLGGFDAIFILKILKEANKRKGYEYYKLVTTFRDNKLLKLEIKVTKQSNRPVLNKKQDNNDNLSSKQSSFNKITLIDSYNLLSSSLEKLSHSFGVEVTKGHFPHNFVKKDTLNYIGNTPSIEYWKGITEQEWNEIFINNWNLKQECLKYLNRDLLSLLQVMNIFNKYVYQNFGVQMTDSLTISRLALNIFLKKYLISPKMKKQSCLPIIKQNMYNDIRKAYFGGVTEVYIPYGKDLYYYDVNSLYPFAALNPMPGNKCTYLEFFNDTSLACVNNLFGYFYCEIETNNNYFGLLPLHIKLGLVMSNGKWSGWYFSEQLKFAVDKGYKVKVIKGYHFNKEENVFNEYVNDFFKIKALASRENKGSIKIIAKSLLNNLLGRFGLNIQKPVTDIISLDEREFLQSTREFVSEPKQVTDQDFLVTYYPAISKEICSKHNLDYIKVLNTQSKFNVKEKDAEFKDVSISTAAAVTSYARIYMSKIKLLIHDLGGKVYYTDTDSIVTNIELPEHLVGKGLGQFKLEHKIQEAYFISNKTYFLRTYDNKVTKKAKGVKSDSLTEEDYINMYNNQKISAIKTQSQKDWSKGSVIIKDKTINLDPMCYLKREKNNKQSRSMNRYKTS